PRATAPMKAMAAPSFKRSNADPKVTILVLFPADLPIKLNKDQRGAKKINHCIAVACLMRCGRRVTKKVQKQAADC
ncbi:MAG: hypothetical protein AB1592_10045, partial [Pseudomonadota bacterium]